MTEPDKEGYLRFIEDTNKREMSNSESYDKSLLTLSSVILGLSLTFTENVVPLAQAKNIYLLVAAWGLLSLTIVMVMSSFIYSMNAFKELKLGAKRFFLENDQSANQLSEIISNNIRRLNVASGVLFIVGVLLFTAFVSVNVIGKNNMANNFETEKKSQPASTYAEQQTKPQSQPGQTQQPSQTGQDNQGSSKK